MRAMWMGIAGAVVIAAIAAAVLSAFDVSSARMFATESTRL